VLRRAARTAGRDEDLDRKTRRGGAWHGLAVPQRSEHALDEASLAKIFHRIVKALNFPTSGSMTPHGQVASTKTGSGRRVDMSAELGRALRRLQQRKMETLKRG